MLSRSLAVTLLLAHLTGMGLVHRPTAAAPVATSSTLTVSITFDDGFADQLEAAKALQAHGMQGTFYVNSAKLGQANRLTWDDVATIKASGSEIGGHSRTHPVLPEQSEDEQKRQICNDRVDLMAHGYAANSFAYPYGKSDATTEAVAEYCGYNSARIVGGLRTEECSECDPGNTQPPGRPYHLQSLPLVVTDTPLEQVEQEVATSIALQAGWVILVFHNICTACGSMAMEPPRFNSLLQWLADKGSAVRVRTVGDVIGGATGEAVPGPKAPTEEGELSNGDLSIPAARTDDSTPDEYGDTSSDTDRHSSASECWDHAQLGQSTGQWVRSYDAQLAATVESVSVTNYSSGDQKLISRPDLGSCSSAALPGKRYVMSVSYRTTANVRLLVFVMNESDEWTYAGGSDPLPHSDTWSQSTWTTPPLPEGTRRLAIAAAASSNGTASFAKFGLSPATSWTLDRWLWMIAGVLVLLIAIAPRLNARRRRTSAIPPPR